jgi:hypothetical protein
MPNDVEFAVYNIEKYLSFMDEESIKVLHLPVERSY